MAYERIDNYDPQLTQKIAEHVEEILALLGEDTKREGLQKTPQRVAKALQYMTKGYGEDGIGIIRQAIFEEDYRQMVLVKDIEAAEKLIPTALQLLQDKKQLESLHTHVLALAERDSAKRIAEEVMKLAR